MCVLSARTFSKYFTKLNSHNTLVINMLHTKVMEI